MAEPSAPDDGSAPAWPDLLGLLPTLTLPHWSVVARCAAPDPAAASAYVVEHDAVARAVPTRRVEFLTGRALARAALGDLGVAGGPIARRPDRSPDWPPGVLGSITHTDGLCAAVVARPTRWPARGGADVAAVLGLGIDAERDQVLDDGVVQRVLTPAERDDLGARTDVDAVVAFAAKEALFKALNPATGVWLEPNEVELEIRRDGSFVVRSWARAAEGVVPEGVAGRWIRFGPWVVTGVVLRSRQAEQRR